MSTTLPLFWHLSSNSKQERIDASLKLITALNQFQAQFTPKADARGSGDDESDKEDAEAEGLDALNAHDVVYSIRRLIRGLSSPRESSRLGFAVALTEVLVISEYSHVMLKAKFIVAFVSIGDCNMLADPLPNTGQL